MKINIKGGLILDTRPQELKNKDYIFGASPVIAEVLQEDCNWENYLPTSEYQYYINPDGSRVDFMNCVPMSALNVFETLHKRKYNYEINMSDRFTAKMSGTTEKGNSQYKVWESIRKVDGMVEERLWNLSMITKPITFQKFYADLPINIIKKGKEIFQDYLVTYEYVRRESAFLCDALMFSPIQVCVNYNAVKESPDGWLYYATSPKRDYTHAVMLYKVVKDKYWEVYDHYDQSKKKIAWDFVFGSCIKCSINKLTNNLMSSEFVKTKDSPAIYLRTDSILIPMGDEATYFNCSGKTQFEFRLIGSAEMATYKVAEPVFS